jgi:tripartite-type tricarboxylate transporter receptor subunit TctC
MCDWSSDVCSSDLTIEFIVPRSPGGGYDTYARLMVPYLQKYTGAKTVVVKNIDGAGGLLGTNEMYRAPGDGLTIGIHGGINTVSNVLAKIEGVIYEIDKFGWIGRISTDFRALTVKKGGPYENIEAMINSDKPVKFGATGVGGGSYLDIVICNTALGIKDEVVSGYEGSGEIDLGIIRGDVVGTWGSLASRKKFADAGDAKIILQSGEKRSAELPDVPTWFEVVKTEEGKTLLKAYENLVSSGRPISTSAGVPKERLEFLRAAFDQVMKDPDFIKDAEKAKQPLDYLSGQDIEKMMVELTKMPEDIKKVMVSAIEGKL